ncbi:MAG: PEP-CTERM sorting domain-containing protein [Parvularculaceae bacterium]
MASSAMAATTIFPASVYGTTGNVVNAANAVGPANGLTSTITRAGGGSTLTLQFSNAFSGLNTAITGLKSASNVPVVVSVGEIISGTAVFSATTITLPNAVGPNFLVDLSAACATISSTGCSLIRFRVNDPGGSSFNLDGVSGVAAAPEPAVWAMMLLGFLGVASRLKRQRKMASVYQKLSESFNVPI